MANDSTAAGFLLPVAGPVYDDALDDQIRATIAGVTGLDPLLVMPRWQADTNPTLPEAGVNWCSAGITDWEPDGFPAEVHNGSDGPFGEGTHSVINQEDCMAMLTFYGPNANGFEANFRAGMQLAQNRVLLDAVGLAYISLSKPISRPDLRQMQWLRCVEVRMWLRRQASFTFGIRNLNGATVQVNTDTNPTITDSVTVNPPSE